MKAWFSKGINFEDFNDPTDKLPSATFDLMAAAKIKASLQVIPGKVYIASAMTYQKPSSLDIIKIKLYAWKLIEDHKRRTRNCPIKAI